MQDYLIDEDIDYDSYHTNYECRKCEDRMKKIHYAAANLETILDHIYGMKQFNPLELENKLDELCFELGVELRTGDMQIQKKPTYI